MSERRRLEPALTKVSQGDGKVSKGVGRVIAHPEHGHNILQRHDALEHQ